MCYIGDKEFSSLDKAKEYQRLHGGIIRETSAHK